jgi:hypothetical protein
MSENNNESLEKKESKTKISQTTSEDKREVNLSNENEFKNISQIN